MPKDDLELKKLDLETQKLEYELGKIRVETDGMRSTQSARGQVLEWFKAFAGLGAAITAVVALFGLWLSVARWQDESEQIRKGKEQEQLSKAFDSLSADSPAKRLSGVASVRSFFATSSPQQQQQILEVVISILAIEKESLVRDSILAMIRGLDANNSSADALAKGLSALTRASRTLVITEDLRNTRMEHPLRPPKSQTGEAIAKAIGESISDMLRNGVRVKDLSAIYCVKCDFSGLDLSGFDFSNSILFLSNFENAKLVESNFDAADLEYTRFENSDLQRAKLTHLEDPRPGGFRLSYVERLFNRARDRPNIAIFGPNFNCADLREADFTGHPIFGFASKQAPGLASFSATFVSANLEGTNFAGSRMFGSRGESEALPFPSADGTESTTESRLFQYTFSHIDFKRPGEIHSDGFDRALHWLEIGFSGSNWNSAILPSTMRAYLGANSPPKAPDFGINPPCKPGKW